MLYAMKQQYEHRIAAYKYRYGDKEAKQLLVCTNKLLGNLIGTYYIGDDYQPQESRANVTIDSFGGW